MTVELNGLKIKNPFIAASGTFGLGDRFPEYYGEAGAFVSKTVTLKSRSGNPPPRIVETPSGIVNSVGLENPGIDRFLDILKSLEFPTCFIASVNAVEGKEVRTLIEKLESEPRLSGYELNLSCPNIARKEVLPAVDLRRVGRIVAAVRTITKRWVCAKLPPYSCITAGPVCEENGCNALCVSNTYPSIAYTPNGKRVRGGLSGPAIKPMVLYNVSMTASRTNIPVIASGGVMTGRDAWEMMNEGATAVQIGTAQFVYPDAIVRIMKEWKEFEK